MKFINIISHLAKAAFVVAFIFICCISTAWAQTPSGNWNDWVNDNNIDWSSDEAKAAAIPQSDDGSTVYISTAEQLAYYAYAVNNDKMTSGSASGYYCGRTVELMADIDLSEHYWKPIGWNKNYYFNGYFHGNGHVITGIHVNGDPKSDDTQAYPCYGLFGYLHKRSVGTSTITDLVLKDFSITASYSGNNMSEFYLGGLVGRCDDNTAITNCLLVNGSVSKSVSNICAHIGKVAGGGSPSTATANYYHNVSVSGWNDGFDTYSQQTIGGETEARAVALTISGTHGSVALGGTVGRISGGIIYAPANETVTLNTTADAGYQFDGYAATGLTIASGQFTMPDNDDGTITATFSINPAHFSDDGGDEYTIHTAAGWGVFCDLLAEANGKTFFSGKTVKLGDDIGSAENPVTRMAGSDKHDFCGTFDGDEHTITLDGNSANGCYALFRNAVGATIRDLHVTGTITTAGKYAAGFISGMWGNVTIENCRSSVIIRSSVSGDGTHGGFVAVNNSGTLDITGCTFDGKLLTTGTTATSHCGGFVGWNAGTLTITNSLYAPADLADGETEIGSECTFARNGATLTNCYYTRALGTAQGKQARTITAGDNVTVGLCGTATKYDVSGITAYAKGILYNNAFYAGSGDEVSLTLSNTVTGAPLGYQYGYTASAGTLAADGTLTMPDEDVTISVNTAALRSDGLQHEVSYTEADGTARTAQAVALDGHEAVGGTGFVHLAAGTYYVGTDIAYANPIWFDGDITLILCDGCTMNVGESGAPIEDANVAAIDGFANGDKTFTIYGQTLGTGALNVYASGTIYPVAISVDALTVNGGNIIADFNGTKIANPICSYGDININRGTVTATATGDESYGIYAYNGTVNINGGTVTANGTENSIYGIAANINGGTITANGGIYVVGENGDVAINGGNVTASRIYSADGTIILGWNKPTDRITASSYSGTVAVADGKKLHNGSDYLGGTLGDPATALNGKTLRPAATATYTTADGTAATADAILLDASDNSLPAGNYLATGTLNYTHGITLTGDVTLILADNCHMNVGTSEERIEDTGIFGFSGGSYSITITSQSLGDDMGALSVYTTGMSKYGILANAITIDGGNVTADTDGRAAVALNAYGALTINGGTVTATTAGTTADAIYAAGDFNYNGGNVTATAPKANAIRADGGNYTFSWRTPADRITIGAKGLYIKDGFTATFNKLLTDGEGNYYSGTLTGDEMNVLAGKTLQPCTAVTLADTDSDLDKKLTALDGATLDVTLAARTIDTEWNTLTVPFDASAEQLTETFGEGVKLYELSGSTLDNGVLGLEFASATSIEAGKPYFIKASADVVNPTFSNVTIEASANDETVTNYVDFIPTLGVTTVEGESLWEVLVLGGGNTLYNPAELPAMMKAFRGYFRVHDAPSEAMQYRMTFDEESDVTGIVTTQVMSDELGNKSCGIIYNLMGQKVNRAEKGLFIVNGKRVIIK